MYLLIYWWSVIIGLKQAWCAKYLVTTLILTSIQFAYSFYLVVVNKARWNVSVLSWSRISDNCHILPEMILYLVNFNSGTDEKVELLMICGSETSRSTDSRLCALTLSQSKYERFLDADNTTMYISYGGKALQQERVYLTARWTCAV